MDRTEATRRFCRDLAGFLTSKDATTEAVRKVRLEWASVHKLHPSERFSNNEIAREVLHLYLRSHHVSEDAFLRTFSETPFIAEELGIEDLKAIHRAVRKPEAGVLRPGDLGRLDQEDFVSSVIERLRAQAGTRVEVDVEAERAELARLRAEVEADRAALAKFKSDLDSIDADTGFDELVRGLPEKPPDERGRPPVPWWKEIGLVGDPFPTYTGLDEIPPEKYDDVIVQTPFFKKHVEDAETDPGSLLSKTVLVSGEFGSGKTTLFQYLSATVGRQGIIPVRVDFVTYDQTESLIRELALRICDSLATLWIARYGEDPRREGIDTDPISLAGNLFQTLQSERGNRGFLICIDGLHKGTLETRSIFTFLQQLQNLQENLLHRGVRAGFLVAGSPLWDRAIEQSPSLSGSFHRRDIIPPLDEGSAVQAVTRRITAFSGNSALAPTISTGDLRRSFQILSQRIQRPLTFRDFLKDTGNRLEARAFADAGVSVALHFETVEAVQTLMSQSDAGRRVLSFLGELRKSVSMRDASREVLLTILEKGGVSEKGELYHRLRPAFFLLRRFELIKQRRAETTSTFEWTIAADVKSTIADISQRLSVSPKTTLEASLEEGSTARRAEAGVVYEAARVGLQSLLPAWRDQWPALVAPLETCLRLLDEVDSFTTSAKWIEVSGHHFTDSVGQLVSAINVVATGGSAEGEALWTIYRDSWYAPENVERIVRFSPSNFHVPTNESSFFGTLHDHNDVVTQLLRELREFLQGEGICRLSGRNLSHEELATLQRIRKIFGGFGYRKVVDKVAELVEAKIRANCYILLRAAWGDGAFDRLPPDVRAAVERLPERGHPRTRRGPSTNFLYDVSRSEYTKILFEANVSKCVFGSNLPAAGKARLKDDLELIFSLDDRRSHREQPQYFKDHATEIGTCLGALPSILETFHRCTMRLLDDKTVDLEVTSTDDLVGRFFGAEQLNPPSRTWRIPTSDFSRLQALYLKRCEKIPLVVQDLAVLCLSTVAAPEAQLLALGSLLKDELVLMAWEGGTAPTLSITASGMEALRSTRS